MQATQTEMMAELELEAEMAERWVRSTVADVVTLSYIFFSYIYAGRSRTTAT